MVSVLVAVGLLVAAFVGFNIGGSSTGVAFGPAVVADRIERVVDALGDPGPVHAGADCGLGTFAGFGAVHPPFAWRKLEALAAGADLATERVY